MSAGLLFPRTPRIIGEDGYKKYAVLMPLIPSEDGWEVLFEVRASALARQPGEICFPGGGLEPGEGPVQAALRETAEELLIPEREIELVTEGDLFLHPGSLMVHSYLGILRGYEGSFSRSEVEEVFPVPLKWLTEQTPETYRVPVRMEPPEDFPYDRIPDGRGYAWRAGSYEVKFYQYGSRTIWGMTARMLEAMTEMIRQTPGLLPLLERG